MRNNKITITDGQIEQFEEQLVQIYGEKFLLDLQFMCNLKRSISPYDKLSYFQMLRGAWYAANQERIDTKKLS